MFIQILSTMDYDRLKIMKYTQDFCIYNSIDRDFDKILVQIFSRKLDLYLPKHKLRILNIL